MEMTVKEFRKLCKLNNIKLTIKTIHFSDLGHGSKKFFKTKDNLKRLFSDNIERIEYINSLSPDDQKLFFIDVLFDNDGNTILKA